MFVLPVCVNQEYAGRVLKAAPTIALGKAPASFEIITVQLFHHAWQTMLTAPQCAHA
jgi:hypothetical protein